MGAVTDRAVEEEVWVAALLPGDPLAVAARRMQDALAAADVSSAHALPPLLPVDTLRPVLQHSGRAIANLLRVLHDQYAADPLVVCATPRAARGGISLPLAERGALDYALSRLPGTGLEAADGGLVAALRAADGLLLAPAAALPSGVTGVLTPLRQAETRTRRWHAAILRVTYRVSASAAAWEWELLGARKLRRWLPTPDH